MSANPGDERQMALLRWLASLPDQSALDPASLAPASSDASFRRYFRILPRTPLGLSRIVMDAPVEFEDCRTFVAVARRLEALGVNVPEIIDVNFEEGFLLLSDLGNTTYLSVLEAAGANGESAFAYANPLYLEAIETLVRIQRDPAGSDLPHYDAALLMRELDLFETWYVRKHLSRELTDSERADLARVLARIVENNLAQPRVTVHRDYHSRNLMLANSSESGSRDGPGVLDFQDAVYGPITYDLVSLLRDAYIRWEEEEVLDWAIRYWEKARAEGLPVQDDFGDFWRDFEWMGLQRHLKVLGIFARLYHRDGKPGYLKDLPLVLHYAEKVCARYSALAPLRRLFDALETREVTSGYTF